MKGWRTFALWAVVVFATLAALAYANRTALVLALVKWNAQAEVAPYSPIEWQKGPLRAERTADQRPPNIVFILVDDLGINDLKPFGGGIAGGAVSTPNIDRLAAEGAVFTQAYAGTATCAPSRAMLMTGRYPTRHGFEFTPMVEGMASVVSMIRRDLRPDLPEGARDRAAAARKPPYEDQGLPSEEVTIAEVLQKAGYHTVHIGKWHLGRTNGSAPNDQGFDESLLMDSGLYLPEDHPRAVNAKVDFDPIDRFLWAAMRYSAVFNAGPRFEPGGYLTDWWTDESLRVIEANRNRPFFLYLAHWGVHTPLQATREDYEAVGDLRPHRLRVYAAMIRALDRSVGRIMQKLANEGLDDNTIIVFSSDNGGAGYIGLADINAPYRGWKMTFYEGGIRVPMVLRWPARIAPGRRISTPVSHIDLLPTLAAAAKAPLPTEIAIDGVNLLPEALGEKALDRQDRAIFWQSGDYQAVRAGDWKLQRNGQPGKAWLYDLSNDPTERIDLSAQRPDKLAELSALLEEHRRARRSPLWPAELTSAVMVDKSLDKRFEDGDHFVLWPN